MLTAESPKKLVPGQPDPYCSDHGLIGGGGGGEFQRQELLYGNMSCGVSVSPSLSLSEISKASSVPLVSNVLSTGHDGFPVRTMFSMPLSSQVKCIPGRPS